MKEKISPKTNMKILDITYIALFSVIIAICSWISVPTAVPFTLQTFGVFAAVGVLGGKRGTISVLVYLLLGMVGVPVFAGFTGGIGHILGSTGGYIVGFLASSLVMWIMEKLFGKKTYTLAISMVIGLTVCYAFGTAWFMFAYARNTGDIGLMSALGMCVIPYLITDGLKIALALIVSRKISGLTKS